MSVNTAEITVRALLEAAGIAPPEAQIAIFTRMYPVLRASADALHVPETRDEPPAILPAAGER